jgi:hypothetical protein
METKERTNRLYQILFPNQALIASQLDPEEFARHYLVGSTRHYSGKLAFAEIDNKFRHPYFKIDEAFAEMIPHPDGSPKRTKFICSYRVMEHMDFDFIRKLYLTTSEAAVLELSPGVYDKTHQPGFLRTYAEIAPLSMLVISPMNMPDFGAFITEPGNPKGAPKLFYAQIELNTEEFLATFEQNPFAQAPFSFLHPSKLRDAILGMKTETTKSTKGLSLFCPLDQISFKKIRHGFMFASQNSHKFFPMPSPHEIEAKNFKFWQGM